MADGTPEKRCSPQSQNQRERKGKATATSLQRSVPYGSPPIEPHPLRFPALPKRAPVAGEQPLWKHFLLKTYLALPYAYPPWILKPGLPVPFSVVPPSFRCHRLGLDAIIFISSHCVTWCPLHNKNWCWFVSKNSKFIFTFPKNIAELSSSTKTLKKTTFVMYFNK